MKQIREVQTWKPARRPARAVMCETRDLGIKWPCLHTLVHGDKIKIDMRYVSKGRQKDADTYRWPDQCTGRRGKPSTNMKSWKREQKSTKKLVAILILARQNIHASLSRRIYEKAFGKISTWKSWRSKCKKKNQLIEPPQSCVQIYLMPRTMKIPDAKSNSGEKKNWKNLTRYPHGNWRKSETNKRWSLKERMRAKQR